MSKETNFPNVGIPFNNPSFSMKVYSPAENLMSAAVTGHLNHTIIPACRRVAPIVIFVSEFYFIFFIFCRIFEIAFYWK